MPKAQANGIEVVSLQTLQHRADALQPPPYGTLLRRSGSDPVSLLPLEDTAQQQFDSEQIRQFLVEFHAVEVEKGLLDLQAHGENLILRGRTELLASVLSELGQFEAIVTRQIAVDAALYEWSDEESPSAFATPEQLGKLVQGRKQIWSGSARTRSGVPVALDRERWTHYVRDDDVEVAEKSSISLAKVDAFFEGIRLVATPHALAGSQDLVIYAQVAIGRQRGQSRIVPTGVQKQSALDVPVLESNFGGFCGRVPTGGALLVTMAGHGSGGSRLLLTVSPRYLAPPTNPVVDGIGILPISALTTNALQQTVAAPLAWPELNGEQSPEGGSELEGYGRVEADVLLDLLRTSVGTDLEAQGTALNQAGAWILLKAGADTRARVENTLRALQDRWLQNCEVRFEVRLRECEGNGIFAPTAADATRSMHCVTLPSLLGRSVVFSRGLETTGIVAFMTEIANSATGINPVVANLRSGVWLRALTAPTQTGLDVQLAVQVSQMEDPPHRVLESEGNLVLPCCDSVRARHLGEMTSGKELALGDGPAVTLDSKNYRSSVTARVTRK